MMSIPVDAQPTGIQIEDISKSYRAGQVRALRGASLTIRHGEAFGIIGPNGAGKTTLMGCLLGYLRPDHGRIRIDGHPPHDLAVRSRMGYLPERLVADRWMAGREFLLFHHGLAGLPRAAAAGDVNRAMHEVGLEPAAGRRAIRKYSRGMLQRLGLAQAILGEPRYLFLDEPTSALDPTGVLRFRELLLERKRRGATLILNSHQLREVESLCDRVAFVRGGVVEDVRTVEAGAQSGRQLRIRAVAATPAEAWSTDVLGRLAASCGGALVEARPPEALFRIPDDASAARLIEQLVASGIAVVEAVPDRSNLERLFEETGGER